MKELENEYVPERKFNKNKAKNSFPMDEKTKTSIEKINNTNDIIIFNK